MLIPIGLDEGAGAHKFASPFGVTQTLSQIAVNGEHRMAHMAGLRTLAPPLKIISGPRTFYVGSGSHKWGRPVENLDYDRLTGTPELVAMFYAGLAEHMQACGPAHFNAPLSITVGLPLAPLSGEPAAVEATANAVKGWLRGAHTWETELDGVKTRYEVKVAEVKVTSQPAGALFDHLLDAQGNFMPERKHLFNKPVGVVSIGFNTVELMGIEERAPVPVFTAGDTYGVRRLLDMLNAQGAYSLGELDVQLRAGQLDVSAMLPVWGQEVTGYIEKKWSDRWRRFAAILAVGGGAILLQDTLRKHFEGKVQVAGDPVFSIARGLLKLGMPKDKKSKG